MQFSTKKVYGGLKDSDRIFTNLYKDEDPFIEGALKRVKFNYFVIFVVCRVIGIKPKISWLMDLIGLLMK
jgi:hypothetical protein